MRPHLTAPEPVRHDEWPRLRRLLAQAVLLQDAAEELLNRFPERPDPAEVAPACGRVRTDFAELRRALGGFSDPEVRRYCAALRQIFDHHALFLDTSMGLLAGAARVEALAERLNDIDGLGAPARRLEALRHEAMART